MAKIIQRWHESTFHVAGQPIRLALKALSFGEAPGFVSKMVAFAKSVQADDAASTFEVLDQQFVADVFARYVKPAEPIEDDSRKVLESGADIYSIANPGLVMDVLVRLQALASLTEVEGKDSGSPSTSPVGEPGSSGSAATSTDAEAGPRA